MTHSKPAGGSEGSTLVVLAAGLGRRFRGPKQLEPMGPAGETLSDYGVWDARQAGAVNVLFVTRADLVDPLRAHHSRWGSALSVEHVVQRIDDLPAGFIPPPGRTRPWGTVHALLTARSHVRGPFAVVNADDFYGRETMGRVGGFLSTAAPDGREVAVAGYRLRDTLSAHGGVSRALLDTGSEGAVRRIIELVDVAESPAGITGRRGGEAVSLGGDDLVSMNLWAMTPSVFDPLAKLFARFLQDHGGSATAECALPDAMNELLAQRRISVRALLPGSDSSWFGITHPADLEPARAAIRRRVAQGDYPADLFRAARG